MAKFWLPEPFDFSQPTTWPAWKQRWTRYSMMTKLDKDDKDLQVSTLVYCMGSQAEEIFASFKWDADDNKKHLTKVMEQFDKYFVPRRNVIFEGVKCGSREQYIDESIETYVCSLY